MFWNSFRRTAKRQSCNQKRRVPVRRLVVESLELRQMLSVGVPFGSYRLFRF
jgi:hypothetical protein